MATRRQTYMKEYSRKWYLENKLQHDENSNKYSKLHRDERRKYRLNWYAEAKKSYFKLGAARLMNLKNRAKQRKIPFSITLEEFEALYKNPCFVKGCIDEVTGLDRIDSSSGYVSGNIRPSCKRHNQMKNDMTDAEFIKKCREVISWADATGTKNGL